MTKALERALDRMKTGDQMSAAVTVGGYCVARIANGVFLQRKKKPVGFGWSVKARCRPDAEIFITPLDKAVLIIGNANAFPHIRVDFEARKAVAHA